MALQLHQSSRGGGRARSRSRSRGRNKNRGYELTPALEQSMLAVRHDARTSGHFSAAFAERPAEAKSGESTSDVEAARLRVTASQHACIHMR